MWFLPSRARETEGLSTITRNKIPWKDTRWLYRLCITGLSLSQQFHKCSHSSHDSLGKQWNSQQLGCKIKRESFSVPHHFPTPRPKKMFSTYLHKLLYITFMRTVFPNQGIMNSMSQSQGGARQHYPKYVVMLVNKPFPSLPMGVHISMFPLVLVNS